MQAGIGSEWGMALADGGVVALSGFRYQILRALEDILELHRNEPGGDWAVEVEHATNDKVDYAVYESGILTRAVQVKASLPGSSTRLVLRGSKGVATILLELAAAFPAAPVVALVSNRQGPWDDIDRWVANNQPAEGPRLQAARERRTLEDMEQIVSELLREGRQLSGLPSDPSTISALASILEARLWRLGSQRLAATSNGRRWLLGADVQEILGMRDQKLAEAVGEATWAMKWKEPSGRAIARPKVLSFLAYELSNTDLARGIVRRAALTGFGGLGKSMVAADWAAEHQTTYAMVLWLTASTSEALEAGVRELLAAEYGVEAATWSALELQKSLREWLQTSARSWLLILDDADSVETVDGWIPDSGYGHVLITTRDSAWPTSHSPSMEVGRLDDGEIQAMVDLRLGAGYVSPEDMGQLAHVTDRWALAVDMVLAWLARHQHSLADLSRFDPQTGRQLLLDQPELVPVGYPEPVLVIIVDALASLQTGHPEAWKLLQSAVALGGEAVPVALASDHTDDTLEDLFKRDKLIAELRSRSLASPVSIGDPRLGQWGHRLNVHALIALQVGHLDPVARDRWGVLLERLALVVGDGAEANRFVFVLSLRVVVTAVDRAVMSGAPFTIGYLTLLGNMAIVLSAAGHYEEAVRRLQTEVHLAETQAAQLTSTNGRPVAWFGLLATLQLATVRIRREEPGEAIALVEEALPKIDAFQDIVEPAKLSNALELAVDVLETIRLPELTAKKDALLDMARGGQITESSSLVRRAEAHLRQDELAEAREVCVEGLACNPRLLEEIDLYGKLAESWAIEDVSRSDELLRLAYMKAQDEEIDLEQPIDDLHNTIHRRIRYLLSLDPIALRGELSTYGGWFLVNSLLPPEGEWRTWRQVVMSRLCRSWHHLTGSARGASRAISDLSDAFSDVPETVSPDEVLGLRTLLWGTQFVEACSSLEDMEGITDIGRKGSTILIEPSRRVWEKIPDQWTQASLSRGPLLAGHRFGPLVLIRVGTLGLFMEAIEVDPFAAAGDTTTICLIRPGGLTPESREVRDDHILELGTIPSLHAEADFSALIREYGALGPRAWGAGR